MKKIEKNINTKLYYAGIGIAILGILILVLSEEMHINIFSIFPECYFHKYTGYFCFGCGSTRAIKNLLQGNAVKSLYYNADIGYLCLLYLWFMISYSLEIITKGKIHSMRIKPVYGYIIIGLSVLQCVFKNVMAFYFNIWLL